MSGCVVVGGGIAGALTAHALAHAGHDVRVLDAEEPGAATPAAAGMLFCILDWNRPWAELAQGAAAAYRRLCAELQGDGGLETRGLLAVGAEAPGLADWAAQRGLPHEILSPDDCRRRYPQLAPPPQPATLLPDIAQIDPRRFMPALRRSLETAGVRWETARATAVMQAQGRALGVTDGARQWPAACVVIAAGAWSGRMQGADDAEAQLVPRCGQIVVWQGADAGDLPIVLDGSRYLVARATGEVLAGATDEARSFDATPTAAAHAELAAFARRWCPELLAAEPDAHWVGLRPKGSADGPRIGAHDAIRGVYFNTGHYRHGIACAPAAAARLAEMCRAAMAAA